MLYDDDNIHDTAEKIAGLMRHLRIEKAISKKGQGAPQSLRDAGDRAIKKVRRRIRRYRSPSGEAWMHGKPGWTMRTSGNTTGRYEDYVASGFRKILK